MDADGVDSSGLGSEDDVADSSRPGSAAPVDGIDDEVAVDGEDSSGPISKIDNIIYVFR